MSLHDIFIDEQQAARCRTLKRLGCKSSPVYGRKSSRPQEASVCPECGTAFHEGETCPMCDPRQVVGRDRP